MEIIKTDSEPYLKVYEISPDTSSDLDWQRTKRFTNWDLAKKYAYELLGYCKRGSLFKEFSGLEVEVDEIELPKPRYCVHYSFKPNKKYTRKKEIKVKVILVEITQEELNELK